MTRSLWPVCGACCEVAEFDWMGGAHHCVVAEPADPLHDEPTQSEHITINGDDLAHLQEFMRSKLLDVTTPIHIAVNSGQICIGADGHVSQWVGCSG